MDDQNSSEDERYAIRCGGVASASRMRSWAENQLRTIHRRRRRYGATGTIRRLHHKLTEEIELVDPETATEAEVALAGQLDGNTSEP